MSTPEQWYKSLPIVTRVGLTACFVMTLVSSLGLLSPITIILNWQLVLHKFQIWRILTNVLYLGPFGFPFLMNIYFFVIFSTKLERNEIFLPAGDYLFFIILQTIALDLVSLLVEWPTGLPTLAPSLIFAIMYYWSRREPFAVLNYWGFEIKGSQFPFVIMFVSLLMGNSLWLDLLGLFTAHLYFFVRETVADEYNVFLIHTPGFLRRLMLRVEGRSVQPDTRAAAAGGPPGGGGGGGPNFTGAGQRLGG
eukprot:Platyproteum_vivax@DN3317_c0_g1_i1.p1